MPTAGLITATATDPHIHLRLAHLAHLAHLDRPDHPEDHQTTEVTMETPPTFQWTAALT